MPRNLTLADGQLGASSATILGVDGSQRVVAVTLHNTAAAEQTVALTVTRSGSTARTIVRVKLKQYETLYVRGLGLDPSDILSGSASAASAVDYLVSASDEPFSIYSRDAEGATKGTASIEVETTEKFGLSRDGIVLAGLLEDIHAVLLKIA